MNSVPNSDSKQCLESKLGQVHSVHTLNPGCAHYAQAAHTAPCRRPGLVVSQACIGRIVAPSRPCRKHVLPCRCTHAPAVVSYRCAHARAVASCHSSLGHDTKLYRNTSPCLVGTARRVARTAPYRGASCAISQAVSLPLLRHKCRPKPRYNFCIATLTPSC